MSLIDDIRSGSSEAVKQLYQENAQDVYDFTKRITGNHDSAMQATKATLSKLVKQIQSGNEPANVHSEALKLAYDEACKLAMPSVQNINSPYDEPEQPVQKPAAREKRQAEAPSRDRKAASSRRKEPVVEDTFDDEDDYEPAPRRRGNKQEEDYRDRRDYRQQNSSRRSRDDYYDDRYDDYDDGYNDYDDYEEKRGHGAGFYICLIINIILVLVLIWFLIGLLINLGVIPDTIDLGYTWFDNTIYPLF